MDIDSNVTGNEIMTERGELLEQMARLEKRRNEVAKDKKSAADDYNDQLKEIGKELDGILAQLEG